MINSDYICTRFRTQYYKKLHLKMILPAELRKRFRKVKERGDVGSLQKLLRFKDPSNVSAILSGDRGTSIDKIEKIKQFIEDREKLVASITDSAA